MEKQDSEEIVKKLKEKCNKHWLGKRCENCGSSIEVGFGWYGWYEYCPICKTINPINNKDLLKI